MWDKAASTIASELKPYLARSSLGKEPLFTPILMGTPRSFADFATASTLSLEPIFPGFILRPSTPA